MKVPVTANNFCAYHAQKFPNGAPNSSQNKYGLKHFRGDLKDIEKR